MQMLRQLKLRRKDPSVESNFAPRLASFTDATSGIDARARRIKPARIGIHRAFQSRHRSQRGDAGVALLAHNAQPLGDQSPIEAGKKPSRHRRSCRAPRDPSHASRSGSGRTTHTILKLRAKRDWQRRQTDRSRRPGSQRSILPRYPHRGGWDLPKATQTAGRQEQVPARDDRE